MESDSTVAIYPTYGGRVIVGSGTGMHVPERWLREVTFVRPDGRKGGGEGNKNLDTAVDNRRSNTISPVYCACTELGDIFQQLFPARVIPSTIYGFASLPLRLRTDLLDFSLHGSMRSRHFHLFARHAERRITISAND